MTLAELQTLRAAVFAQYLITVGAGVESYAVDGRMTTRIKSDNLLKQLNRLDAQIARMQGGGVFVAQFRNKE